MIGFPFGRRRRAPETGGATGNGSGLAPDELAGGQLPATAAVRLRQLLDRRSLVLVGLMGCGKSAIGKRLASRLELPFVDADDEIEKAATMSIAEIFSRHGEPHFRDREEKVIARLLTTGPQVLATGGGAFMSPATRTNIRNDGVSIWLRAELPVLMKRVLRRDHRPLLNQPDPEGVMRRLMGERYPVYAEADVTVESRDVPHEQIVAEIIDRLVACRKLAASRGT